MEERRLCWDCIYFMQHYLKKEGKYYAINFGHCSFKGRYPADCTKITQCCCFVKTIITQEALEEDLSTDM